MPLRKRTLRRKHARDDAIAKELADSLKDVIALARGAINEASDLSEIPAISQHFEQAILHLSAGKKIRDELRSRFARNYEISAMIKLPDDTIKIAGARE